MRAGYVKINLTKMAVVLFTLKVLLDCQNQNLLTVPSFFEYFCIFLGVVAFLVKIIPQRFTLKDFLIFLGSGCLVLFSCLQIKQYDLVISFLTIYLLKDENLDEYVGLILKVQIVMMIVIFCALSIYHMGYGEYIYWFRQDGRIRFTGCMAHPNILASYVLSAVMMYTWLNYDQMTTKKYMVLILINCVTFALTDSRTTFILSLCFILLLYLQNKPGAKQWCEKNVCYMFPVLIMFLHFMVTQYTGGSAWIRKIDELVSGRIKLGAYAYNRSGLTIFPRFLDYVKSGTVQWQQEWGLNEFTFDNIYSFLLVQLGVVWIIFICVVIRKLVKKTDYKCHIYIILWIIYGLGEVHGLNCYRFFPLLLVTLLLKKNKEQQRGCCKTTNY